MRKDQDSSNIKIQESLVGDEEDIILLFMAVINIILRDLIKKIQNGLVAD